MTETETQIMKFMCKKFINNKSKLRLKFSSCRQEKQEWILNYLSSGKETIPFEMRTRFDSLDIKPEQEFFSIKQFYLRLKVDIISEDEYEAMKIYFTMEM